MCVNFCWIFAKVYWYLTMNICWLVPWSESSQICQNSLPLLVLQAQALGPLTTTCVVLFENYFSLISLSIILREKCSYMNSLSLFLCLWESRFHFVEVLLLFYYHFHFVTTAFVGFQWASTALPLRWLND